MRPSILLTGLAFVFAAGSLARAARADDDDSGDYPLPYAGRPLTLTARTLSPYIAADVTRFLVDPSAAPRDVTTSLTVQAGAKFGLSPDLEVDAALAQVQILPALAYGNPTLGATFRLLDSVLEIGVRAHVTIVTAAKTAGLIAEPSVPIQIHLGSSARLDLSPGAPIILQRYKLPTIGLDLPVAFALNPIDRIYLGAQTSFYIRDFQRPGESITIPLGFFAGVTVGTDTPLFDIAPFFTWPQFAQPAVTSPTAQKLNLDLYTAGLSLRGYIFF